MATGTKVDTIPERDTGPVLRASPWLLMFAAALAMSPKSSSALSRPLPAIVVSSSLSVVGVMLWNVKKFYLGAEKP